MTEGKKKTGIKSALDLAMERLESAGGTPQALTNGQKEGLAEVEREVKARIAEVEILTGQRIAEAAETGDQERIQVLLDGKKDEIGRLRRQGESKKDGIRKRKNE